MRPLSRLFRLLALLGTVVPVCSGVAKAADTKTPLIQDVVVHGSSVYLSDLLPESSPGALRVSAQKVLLGGSPQPGSIRVLSNAEIKQLLHDDNENLLSQVNVPEQVAIRRSGHRITREEVAEAIQIALSRDVAFRNFQITLDSIELSARVSVQTDNVDLRVTRIESDRMLHRMKFWLVSATDPTVLPFLAMATIPGSLRSDLESKASNSAKGGPSDTTSVIPAKPAPAVIESGQVARLHMVSRGQVEMYLTAIPLERGALGQTIRVKIQNTGKIVYAHVVGPAHLEAEL